MSVKVTEWDPSEYLDSEESIEAYLNAAFEDDDPQLIASAIGDVARARGMTQISRDTGLAREALYRALSDRGNPELATVISVLKSLKLKVRIESSNQSVNTLSIPIPVEIPSSIYSKIVAAEIKSGSIVANGGSISILSATKNKEVSDEHKRSIVRLAGPVVSARIRTKVSRTGSAPARTTFKHATSSA